MIPAKFGAYWLNHLEVIQISSPVLSELRCLEGVKTKLRAKFGENRANGSGVIQVFVNFKMAAGGHLGL